MEASRLHAFARRRLADQPEACPIDPADMALALTWLSAIETEAEIDQSAVDTALAADREVRRAEMAAGFRQAARTSTAREPAEPPPPRPSPSGGPPRQPPSAQPTEAE
jgi:hypothetical protein